MRYILALLLLLSAPAQAQVWQPGDTGLFRFICKEIQDIAGILKVKDRVAGFQYLMKMHNAGKCFFMVNGSFKVEMVDKLIEADMFDGPSEIWSGEVTTADGKQITGFVIVDARQGPHKTGLPI